MTPSPIFTSKSFFSCFLLKLKLYTLFYSYLSENPLFPKTVPKVQV